MLYFLELKFKEHLKLKYKGLLPQNYISNSREKNLHDACSKIIKVMRSRREKSIDFSTGQLRDVELKSQFFQNRFSTTCALVLVKELFASKPLFQLSPKQVLGNASCGQTKLLD